MTLLLSHEHGIAISKRQLNLRVRGRSWIHSNSVARAASEFLQTQLRAAGKAEQLDVSSWTELIAMFDAVFLQPATRLGQPLCFRSLRHQQHAIAFNFRDFFQIPSYFVAIHRLVDDKFYLIRMFSDQAADDVGNMSRPFVPIVPLRVEFDGRSRICQLRADRH